MTIKTIRRAKWHGDCNWQATDASGVVCAYSARPWPLLCAETWDVATGRLIPGSVRRKPTNWTTTLRRIRPAKKDNT